MGSLTSPSRSVAEPSPESNPMSYRAYAAFCRKERDPKSSVVNQIEGYNPSTNMWHHVTFIPNPIEDHNLKGYSMVSLGDSIYIVGGRVCSRQTNRGSDSDEFIVSDVDVSPSVLRYNIRSDVWYVCSSMSTPRYDFAYTVCQGKIYVAGGKSSLNSTKGISHVEMYDPTLDEWTPLPDMSTLRYKAVALSCQKKVHVIGGFVERMNSDGTVSFTDRSSAEMYNTQSRKWELVPAMWLLDVPPNQIVEVGNRLFSSGDCLNPWKGHIEVYDTKLRIWKEVEGSRLQTLNAPINTSSDEQSENWSIIDRLYLTMVPIGTDLYFFSGYRIAGESLRTLSMVHIFDTRATGNAWRSVQPMIEEGEKELCAQCCVVQLS